MITGFHKFNSNNRFDWQSPLGIGYQDDFGCLVINRGVNRNTIICTTLPEEGVIAHHSPSYHRTNATVEYRLAVRAKDRFLVKYLPLAMSKMRR
jgi:hypothetical protein